MTTRLTQQPLKSNYNIDELFAQAKARVEAMSPEEKKAMFDAQRKSWVKGEMMLESDMTEDQFEEIWNRVV